MREQGKVFNFRVSGAVIKDNKIMLNRLRKDDFWTFVGGKVAFGESTEASLVREYFEETGAQVEVERLAACVENFFIFNDVQWHEILYFYTLKDDNDELEIFEGERPIQDNCDGVYKWFDLGELENISIQPECSKQVLKNLNNHSIQHIINES